MAANINKHKKGKKEILIIYQKCFMNMPMEVLEIGSAYVIVKIDYKL